jgi:hypothetical protein
LVPDYDDEDGDDGAMTEDEDGFEEEELLE